jgi:cytochrome c oxidase assembly factor CtaG
VPLGLFPAALGTLTGLSSAASSAWSTAHRGYIVTTVLSGAVLIGPIGSWSRHLEYVQAIQFAVFAIVAPLLGVLIGAGAQFSARHSAAWDVSLVALYVALVVFFRSPVVVNQLVHTPLLTGVEAIVLNLVAVRAWASLHSSRHSASSLTSLERLISCTLVMWTIWIMAYLVGLSHSSWYRSFDHGHWLSVSADQQLTTGLLWAISAAAFMPFIFKNLYNWLRSEETPTDELAERIRSARLKINGP